ncbi:hypothetical protein RvY_19054-3 [Ramazzottius varieornatus]|uniref:Uncharacterized protein n=1 Tax=Ramazzottius varieornatus TaxID=947166 RepID=A0A1D1WBH0_RAMVA|nr:hypothetical protein RvY_19054-3 [Ramazzottius varieornatus]
MKPSEEERPPRYSQTLCILGCCQILFQTSVTILELADHVSVFAYCEKHQKTKKKIARSRRNFEAEQSAFRPAKGSQDSALGNGPALSVNCVCCHPCDDHGLLHCEACSTRQPGDGRPGEPSLRNSVYSKENDDVARLSMDRSIFYTECLLGKCSHCWIPGSTYTFYLRGKRYNTGITIFAP